MPSQQKLIKKGINYTDKLFKEITERLSKGILQSDTLEEFLTKTKDYTTSNPLVTTGYQDEMINIILQETNNHKFSRPAQKELTRITIEDRVGELIADVGDDIKTSVRDIVKEGYNQNLSQDEIAENISKRVSVIKNKRARAIARTEIARTATISDYVINKERGATHFHVECRNTACPICKKAWHNGWTEENDDNFTPSDKSAGGKGWIGDKTYSMDDVKMLPPIHPNCRCVAYFYKERSLKNPNVDQESRNALDNIKKQVNNIRNRKEDNLKTPEETAEYFGLKYCGVGTDHGKNYHKFYDKDNDCSFYIDDDLTKGSDAVVSLNNNGNCLHNLKDILETYHESLPLMKKTTKSIAFCNYNNSNNDLGLNTRYINPNSKYYGQSFIEIYKNSISAPLVSSSNVHMSLLHEMAHSIDLNSIEGLNISDNPLYPIAVLKDRIDRCSVIAKNDQEDVAEAIAMVVFKNKSDKSFARITVDIPEYDKYGNVINVSRETIGYEEFCVLFENRVSLIENLLGLQ